MSVFLRGCIFSIIHFFVYILEKSSNFGGTSSSDSKDIALLSITVIILQNSSSVFVWLCNVLRYIF